MFCYLTKNLYWPREEINRTQGTIYLTEQGKDKALKEIGEEALEYMIRNRR